MSRDLLGSYPRAILHFDGDAFFASIEQSLDHRLRGKPVVTGAERGAATSLSYEAKTLGARRGMSMREIRNVCPSAIIVPGNYTAYSIYARRMYAIVRAYTPLVEEYSIDECFAEITGLDARMGISYEEIGLRIKEKLETELGITFGVGLAPSKTMAKIASKYRKPSGFTPIPREGHRQYLETLRAGDVWGLGGSASLKLMKLGVDTALQFADKDEAWLTEHKFSKPYREIWRELNGYSAKELNTRPDGRIGSIMKTHTFKPTSSRAAIFAELSKNVEAACAKARRAGVKARALTFYLKTQEFMYYARALELPIPIADPADILRLIATEFDEVYDESIIYRASGITLRTLTLAAGETRDLFGLSDQHDEKSAAKLAAIDRMNRRYGRHTVFLASSMTAVATQESSLKARKNLKAHMPVDIERKTLDIPFLGYVR